MKLITVVVSGLLLLVVSEAQEVRRQWAGRAEYEMATNALGEEDLRARLTGLLAWEAAYPSSEFAVERNEQILYAYQQTASRAGDPDQLQIALLYKVVLLGPTLPKRSAEQVKAIHKAASDLLEELKKPGIVAPTDAKELATRALALEVR
jgi:hypothetical protein